MTDSIHLKSYERQLDDLNLMAVETNNRFLSKDSDLFISKNINFFTKSFMVIMCAYLESYLKDICMVIIDEMNNRLLENQLPYNLIKWHLSKDKDLKEADLKFENLHLRIKKNDLDEYISGSPFRTETLFKKFGIKLGENIEFKTFRDKVNTIIVKRNNIVHYNDDASDLSVNDIVGNILFIKTYIHTIDKIVVMHINDKKI
jgi:hypothetical protein